MENVMVLVLHSGDVLISQIEEVGSELGEPDCKLIKPFVVVSSKIPTLDFTLEPWLNSYTMEDNFMIHSDKIITITKPRPVVLEKYQSLIK